MHQGRSFSNESCCVWHMLWTMGGCIYTVQMTPQISLFFIQEGNRDQHPFWAAQSNRERSKRLSSDLTSRGLSRSFNRALFLLSFKKFFFLYFRPWQVLYVFIFCFNMNIDWQKHKKTSFTKNGFMALWCIQ